MRRFIVLSFIFLVVIVATILFFNRENITGQVINSNDNPFQEEKVKEKENKKIPENCFVLSDKRMVCKLASNISISPGAALSENFNVSIDKKPKKEKFK